jgi:hypothetical protein
MKAVFGVAAIASMLIANPAAAESVNFYFPSCKDFTSGRTEKNPFLQGVCVGLLEGLATFANKLPSEESRSCPPDNVNAAELTKAVVQWLEQRRQRWDEDFRSLAVLALHDTWPCK